MIELIRLYSGTPGSGKSLHNARDVIMRSRFGEPVIGNFPVDLSKYKKAKYTYVPNDKLTPDFLIQYSLEHFKGRRIKEGALLLVIDECQLLFNAREWQQSGRENWLSFFTQHRKLGYDITLIAQFDRMIDRQIRSLIEYEYIHRKVSNFGIWGKVISLVLGGNTFIAVKMWYPLHERIGSEFIHARKSLYGIYDSYATFGTDGEGEGYGVPCPAGPSQKEPEKAEIPQRPEAPTKNQKLKDFVSWMTQRVHILTDAPHFHKISKFSIPGWRRIFGWITDAALIAVSVVILTSIISVMFRF